LIEQAIEFAHRGQKLPDDLISPFTMRVPAYHIPGYAETLQGWIDSSKRGATRNHVIKVQIDENDQGQKSDWTDLGYNTIHPTLRGNAQNWTFLSVGKTKDGRQRPIALNTEGREHHISLELSMVGCAKFDIQGGEW
jgi:hypothetical protein